MKYFLIYLITGLLFNLIGPLASQIRKEMKDLRSQTVPVSELTARRRKLLISEIIFRSLVMLMFPVAYFLWLIDLFRAGNEKREREERHKKVKEAIKRDQEKIKWDILQNRSFIYFKDTLGGGVVRCHGCGFSEEIVTYSHGFEEPRPFTRGYQCQKCGKFHRIQFLGSRMLTPYLKCSCGGELSNVKPLFCPKCKARDVYFVCEYVC
ncbi:MAG TPA: hypothetical protein VHO46_13985 [Bacteroidales bacterium]|nr:hypothetical protein [Bacteroidales bacterium]